MRNKDCISRCLHILCRLKRDQKATFAQIQRYLSDMSILTGEDYNISIRTFQRDLETITGAAATVVAPRFYMSIRLFT